MKYDNEIFWLRDNLQRQNYRTFANISNEDFYDAELDKLIDSYFNVILDKFSEYKNSVVKIHINHLITIATKKDIKLDFLINMVLKQAEHVYFCVREDMSAQLKSLYTVQVLHGRTEPQHLYSVAHDDWEDTKHFEHDQATYNSCKNAIKRDMIILSGIYNSMPDDKKTLAVYEQWASESGRYHRPATFAHDDFHVSDNIYDFFQVKDVK